MDSSHHIGLFSLRDMAQCGRSLRELCAPVSDLETAAEGIVRYLFDGLLQGEGGGRACALVRFFMTCPYSSLDAELQAFAARRLPPNIAPERVRSLALLATRGDEPAWNSRHDSAGHRAIPLASEEMVRSFPMVSQLIQQLGFDLGDIIDPAPELLLNEAERTYGVFYVPEALGSPYIVAQDGFVIPHKIRSVLGFGGMLPTGNMFAAIMFSKVFIPKETAQMFQTIALSVKLALLPLLNRPVFRPASPSP